jgi:ribosomal protein S14
MRSIISSDTFKRRVVQNNQVIRKLMRLQGFLDSSVFVSRHVFNYQCFWVLSGHSCFLKVRKRCFVSGRGRGVSIFGLSRHDLRLMINVGFVNGQVRSTWLNLFSWLKL